MNDLIKVKRDGDRDIKFAGSLIAKVSSPEKNGRRQVLRLYLSDKGKFICQRINYTRWPDEISRFEAKVYTNYIEVIEFFGLGWLAKELYRNAKIEEAEEEV